jgi:hypothetical protein
MDMSNEMKVSTGSYVVVDEKNMARIYSNIASVKIWDKKLTLLSEDGDIIASFSAWKSSSTWSTRNECDL